MEELTNKKYQKWLNEPSLSKEEHAELLSIKDNENEINERFALNLEFGTAGIRGVMAMGTNRMNKYIVRQATQGLAQYLLNKFDKPSVAIAYDSRNNSETFAKETATTLAANGIKVYIYDELMPVPTLSFAVRYLKTSAGVVITASHNPKQYNGYKVYGPDGSQMNIEGANEVLANINSIDVFKDVKKSSFEEEISKKNIEFIPNEVKEAYFASVLKQSAISEKSSPRIINVTYTPLHGTGLKPVTTILDKDGFKNIHLVEEQKLPDGNFTTCPYPNPELKEAMTLAMQQMITLGDDIAIGTDPDSDRAGVAVNQNGQAILLNGNEMGILLFDFIYSARKQEGTLADNPVLVKTIVSTDVVKLMAKKYNVHVAEVLTGFKFIGEQILKLEKEGHPERFILGFEESCGYLTNPDIRDKDAVNAMLLICEMANFYKHQGKTLVDRLNELYTEFGDYKTDTLSFEFPSLEGKQKIVNLMQDFRTKETQNKLGNIIAIGDYKERKIYTDGKVEDTNLPSSDVMKFFLTNNETITIRPSGTEPKIKAYIFANGKKRVDELKQVINSIIK